MAGLVDGAEDPDWDDDRDLVDHELREATLTTSRGSTGIATRHGVRSRERICDVVHADGTRTSVRGVHLATLGGHEDR